MISFLSETDCATLRMKHRSEKDRRVADRIKAVLLSNKGWSYRQIAEALLIDEQTISRHVEEYKVSLKLTLKSGGSVSKLDTSQTACLVLHLETVLYAHVHQIMAYVEKTFGVRYSRQGMTCWLHHHGFGYKKPQGRPYKADGAAQLAFITTYESLKRHTPEDEPILFGDGVHPTMATKISYGWIKSGMTKMVATTASRTRVNLMGALNLETMNVVIGSYDTLDTQAMVLYFDRVRAAYPKAPQLHLILDRSRYNTSLLTQEAAKLRGIKLHCRGLSVNWQSQFLHLYR